MVKAYLAPPPVSGFVSRVGRGVWQRVWQNPGDDRKSLPINRLRRVVTGVLPNPRATGGMGRPSFTASIVNDPSCPFPRRANRSLQSRGSSPSAGAGPGDGRPRLEVGPDNGVARTPLADRRAAGRPGGEIRSIPPA